jgi:hypothetical protein
MGDPASETSAGLDALVGEWTTEATHPSLRGTVVQGTAVFEWLRGAKFLLVTARMDHPDFPDSIAIIGDDAIDRIEAGAPVASAGLRMHYFDERGVHRVYDVRIGAETWELARDAPGFAQRFSGTFVDGGSKIIGLWKLSRDGRRWDDDLRITYRRRPAS